MEKKMPKYRIEHYCGYTKLFIDDREIPCIKSLKFERNGADELATLSIKVIAQEVDILADDLELKKEEIVSNNEETISK